MAAAFQVLLRIPSTLPFGPFLLSSKEALDISTRPPYQKIFQNVFDNNPTIKQQGWAEISAAISKIKILEYPTEQVIDLSPLKDVGCEFVFHSQRKELEIIRDNFRFAFSEERKEEIRPASPFLKVAGSCFEAFLEFLILSLAFQVDFTVPAEIFKRNLVVTQDGFWQDCLYPERLHSLDGFRVRPSMMAFAKQGGQLFTCGLGPCIGVAAWDPVAEIAGLMHLSPRDDVEASLSLFLSHLDNLGFHLSGKTSEMQVASGCGAEGDRVDLALRSLGRYEMKIKKPITSKKTVALIVGPSF